MTRYSIYLDNNVWDLVRRERIDLIEDFPADDFVLVITREAEFEIAATPEPLKSFIVAELKRCNVEVDVIFGFSDDRHPSDEQRVGGWGVGAWPSDKMLEFICSQRHRLPTSAEKRKTRLYKNEADIALGARSFENVVLTLDKKPGPLRDAWLAGGAVVFLNDLAPGLRLREAVIFALRSKP